MKKQALRLFVALCVFIFTFASLPFTASAETQTDDLFYLSETKNMGITVKYETEPPEVEFIAPNGDVFGSKAISSGKMTKTDSGEALFYRIPNAKAGNWQVRYDKKSNANIEIGYAPYTTSLCIDKFSFSKRSDSSLEVKFTVSHDKRISYSYSVYAVVTENGEIIGQKLLSNGGATTNKEHKTSVWIDSLSSYSEYGLMLEVNGEDNGLPIFDSKVASPTFEYIDPYANEAPDGFYLEIGTVEGSVLIDWSATHASRRDALVALYLNDDTEPTYHNTFTYDISKTKVPLDLKSTKKIRVDLSYKDYYDKSSLVASRTVDLSLASAVTVKGEDVTNSLQTEVVYNLAGVSGGPFPATLKVNDTTEELLLHGNNSFSVKLANAQNTIDFIWYYDALTAFRINKEIYSDRVAPVLSIPGVGDKVVTDRSPYILSGYAGAGCSVTVNGNAVTVDQNGVFTTELALQVGENTFTIVATSSSGNRTQQTLVVEMILPSEELGLLFGNSGQFGLIFNYLPLVACILLSITLCLFAVLSRKKFIKVKNANGLKPALISLGANTSVLMSVLSGLVTATFAALWIYSVIKINSSQFYDVVVSSGINEAFELMQLRDKYMWRAIIAAICLAVFIGLSILLKKLYKKQPKNQTALTETEDTVAEEIPANEIIIDQPDEE